MSPETQEVDLGPVERIWNGLKLDALPSDFSWTLEAQNYARAIRKHVKNDPTMREVLSVALEERAVEAAERMAGPEAGFDLAAYREHLKKTCAGLHLSVMRSSTYSYDRKITLWSIFVPQLARESAPILEVPREIERQLRKEGHLTSVKDEREIAELRERYRTSVLRPVLEILERERLVVVLGNPGSGKTSVLKYQALQWARENRGLLPVLIDLREYVKERDGLLKYCESGCTCFHLDARELDKRLKAGGAALYLDGLDEIFDLPTRGSVIKEIITLVSRYPQAPIVVTSRIVGYESEQLRGTGFLHATLEDFDNSQVLEFLRLERRSRHPRLAERPRAIRRR